MVPLPPRIPSLSEDFRQNEISRLKNPNLSSKEVLDIVSKYLEHPGPTPDAVSDNIIGRLTLIQKEPWWKNLISRIINGFSYGLWISNAELARNLFTEFQNQDARFYDQYIKKAAISASRISSLPTEARRTSDVTTHERAGAVIEKLHETVVATSPPTVTEKAQTPTESKRSIAEKEPGKEQTAAEQGQEKEKQAEEESAIVTPQIEPPKTEKERPTTPPTPSSTSTASKPSSPPSTTSPVVPIIPKKPSEAELKALRELLEQQAAEKEKQATAKEESAKQAANITPPKAEEERPPTPSTPSSTTSTSTASEPPSPSSTASQPVTPPPVPEKARAILGGRPKKTEAQLKQAAAEFEKRRTAAALIEQSLASFQEHGALLAHDLWVSMANKLPMTSWQKIKTDKTKKSTTIVYEATLDKETQYQVSYAGSYLPVKMVFDKTFTITFIESAGKTLINFNGIHVAPIKSMIPPAFLSIIPKKIALKSIEEGVSVKGRYITIQRGKKAVLSALKPFIPWILNNVRQSFKPEEPRELIEFIKLRGLKSKEHEDLEKQLPELQTRLFELQASLSELEQNIELQSKFLSSLEPKEHKELKTHISKLEKKHKELEKERKELEKKTEKIEKRLSELKSEEREKLRKLLSGLKPEERREHENVEQLLSKLESEERKLESKLTELGKFINNGIATLSSEDIPFFTDILNTKTPIQAEEDQAK